MPGFAMGVARVGRALGLLAITLVASACSRLDHPIISADPGVEALAIADAVVDDALAVSPDLAATLREPGTRYDALPDDSIAGVEARQKRRLEWLQQIRKIDCPKLADPARLACEVARRRLDDLDSLRVCRSELWTVSQMMNGWQVRLGNLAYTQPVGTPELRQQALTRFAALPAYIDAQTDNLRQGMRTRYRATQVTVRLVIDQVSQLIGTPAQQSPFFSPAERDGDAEMRVAFQTLVGEQINPALRRYRDFLRDEYLPQARSSIGVDANPNGAACYRAALRYSSGFNSDPGALHRLGQAELDRVQGATAEIPIAGFEKAPIKALLPLFRTNREFTYRSPDEMMGLAKHTAERTYRALPAYFGLLPASEAIVEPIPAYQERSAAPHYLAAALDGSRPAAYRIRLYQATKQSWVGGEATAFHEVVPGHHLQVNIANNLPGLPRITRLLFFSGFGEGWGLYAERLADEMQLYSTPPDRMGMLLNFQWRVVRVIVDTGIHALGWSRQQAIDLLLANTALSADQAAAEIDRYIAWPGQAPSYLLGYREIRRLRAAAKKALGPRFDIRQFHDAVLRHGSVPLPVLRARVNEWIAQQVAPTPTPLSH